MRTMARAEIAVEVSRIRQRNATQMSANAEENEPFRLFNSLVVGLRITQSGQVDRLLFLDFGLSAMADKQRLASPLDRQVLAFWYVAKFNFDFRQSENISRWSKIGHNITNNRFRSVSSCQTNTESRNVGEGLFIVSAVFALLRRILRVLVAVLTEVWYSNVGMGASERLRLGKAIGDFKVS